MLFIALPPLGQYAKTLLSVLSYSIDHNIPCLKQTNTLLGWNDDVCHV